MKHVVDSSMVAHLWAHQSQDNARNQRGNLYFDGPTIFSYGSHFPIASHTTGARNKQPLILFTTRTYSNTTNKQIQEVRIALRGDKPVIRCYNPRPQSKEDHQKNLKGMREDFDSLTRKAAKARTKADEHIVSASRIAREHAAYREFFGLTLDKPLILSEDWKAETTERIKRVEAAEVRKNKTLIKNTLEVIKYWKQGDKAVCKAYPNPEDRPKTDLNLVPIALRQNGDEIETTKGAKVPLSHARVVWTKIKQVRHTQVPYQTNGHTLHAGPFCVDRIEIDGTLKAGCHTITFDAMSDLAERLGW